MRRSQRPGGLVLLLGRLLGLRRGLLPGPAGLGLLGLLVLGSRLLSGHGRHLRGHKRRETPNGENGIHNNDIKKKTPPKMGEKQHVCGEPLQNDKNPLVERFIGRWVSPFPDINPTGVPLVMVGDTSRRRISRTRRHFPDGRCTWDGFVCGIGGGRRRKGPFNVPREKI